MPEGATGPASGSGVTTRDGPGDAALVLRARGLGVALGGAPVLGGIDLDVAAGEFVALLGASGTGKSTLLRLIAGLLPADRGRLELDGVPAIDDGRELVPAERRKVGMVFQDYALFPTLTVAGNVAFGLRKAQPDRVAELLDSTGLTAFADRMPHQLSGGQQQRVALARALAPRPRLLLLDEPFANIDVSLRAELGQQLEALVRREQVAVVLVTHDHQEALALADRIAVLTPGADGAQVAQVDAPEVVWSQPATAAVAALFGTHDLIDGEARGGRIETPLGSFRSSDLCSDPCACRDGPVRLVVRPEQLRFETDPAGDAEVIASGYLGGRWRLRVRIGALALTVICERARPAIGSRGRIATVGMPWPLAR